MKKQIQKFFVVALLTTALGLLAGCGGGGGGGSGSSDNSSGGSQSGSGSNNNGDLALSSIGGRTLHGHIGGTSINWEMRFSGTGSSGNYTHFENGAKLESGTYTYSKNSSNTGVINVSPNGQGVISTIQLTYTSAGGGTYSIVQFPETGTFAF